MFVGLEIDVGILRIMASIAKGAHLFAHVGRFFERLYLLQAFLLVGIERISISYPLFILTFHILPIGHLQRIVTAPARYRKGHRGKRMLLHRGTIGHHTGNQLNQEVGTDAWFLDDLLGSQSHHRPSMAIEQMIAKHIATRYVVDRLASGLTVRLINLDIDTETGGTCHHQRQIGIIRRLLVGSDDASV